MSLFDFVKEAGKQLWDTGDAEAAEAIAKEVGDPSLKDKLDVEIEGETVKVSGEVPSQEIREKVILAAGNVKGISKVEENLTMAQKQPASDLHPLGFHTVAKGDTLWAIAKKSYGDGSKFKTIFEANRPMLSDPNEIYPGQRLRIPAKAA